MTPRLALVLGHPAGIEPEIMARPLAESANRDKAALLRLADEEIEIISPALKETRRRGLASLLGRYHLPSRAAQGRPHARRGCNRHDVPRSGADRDEADGLLARHHGGLRSARADPDLPCQALS
jgi:hypothetical protein